MSFTGNLNVWAQLLHAGATLVLASTLRSTRWKALLDRYPVTLLYLVPVKLKLLLQVLDQTYPEMKTVLAGSQLLDGETARKLKKHFPHSQILLYYGASELDYITWLTYEELLAHSQVWGSPAQGEGGNPGRADLSILLTAWPACPALYSGRHGIFR